MALTSLSFQSLVAAVADQLRSAIASGEFAPGSRLIQEDLAEQLGVSRVPVRQALGILESEGLVIQRPRRGAIVTAVGEQDVRDVYDVRAALDGLGARRAAERLDQDFVSGAERIIESAHQHLRRNSMPRLLAADRDFHLLIIEASGNKVASETVNAQWNRIGAVMRAVLESGYAGRAWLEHEAILTAITQGDAEAAETLARQHAWGAAEMLMERIQPQSLNTVRTSA